MGLYDLQTRITAQSDLFGGQIRQGDEVDVTLIGGRQVVAIGYKVKTGGRYELFADDLKKLEGG